MKNFVDDDVIQVSSGNYVSVISPHEDDISIYDIAHALSNTGRYGGHSKFFYSVAQHSVLGSFKTNSFISKWEFLMHDACEAYILDVPSPLKYNLPDYLLLEKKWEIMMFKKFDVSYPFIKEVKKIDLEALATERRDLLHPNGDWSCLEGVKPWKEKIIPWSPIYSEYRFLKRVNQLKPHWEVEVPNRIIPIFVEGFQRIIHLFYKRRIPKNPYFI